MASDLFWHVPVWFEGKTPANAVGSVQSVGANLFVELLETDTASSNLAPDNYWVERIVGQVLFQRNTAESDSGNWYLQHRVYVTPASNTGIVLRDLSLADDADTSWMFNKTELMLEGVGGTTQGDWSPTVSNPSPTFNAAMSRNGGIDIRVGRKVSEGESLIWHSQIIAEVSGNLVNSQLVMKAWIRVLLRQM